MGEMPFLSDLLTQTKKDNRGEGHDYLFWLREKMHPQINYYVNSKNTIESVKVWRPIKAYLPVCSMPQPVFTLGIFLCTANTLQFCSKNGTK